MSGVRALVVVPLGLLAIACSDPRSVGGNDPADFTGEYTVNVTNAKNSCPDEESWKEGDTRRGFSLTITQTGGAVTAKVGGLEGGGLWLGLGSSTYAGTATDRQIELSLLGTNTKTLGSCTYTINSVARAELNGDVLAGTVTYTRAVNAEPDCQALVGCSGVQLFNGVRPPRP